MAIEVVIPRLGVTVEGCKIVQWLKNEGESVQKGESIILIEAGRVTTEVESPASGILAKILLPAGEKASAMAVAGVISSPGEAVPDKYLRASAVMTGFSAPAGTMPVTALAPAVDIDADSHHDLAVVGGGPGGYVAAICGARKGLRTVLIEKDALGGTCLNRGCIPTKSFIYDTKLFRSVLSTPVISGSEKLQLDVAKLLERKCQVVKTLVSGVSGLVKSNGVELITGKGILESPGRITVSKSDGSVVVIKAKNVVLANGSKPAVPPFIKVDGKLVQTTDEILKDPTFPENILIIGGGVIGIEMAAIFLNAGSNVTIIEILSDILITEDKDVRNEMKRQLKKCQAKVLLNTSVKDLSIEGSQVKVTFRKTGGDEPGTMMVDKVLVATGRAPVLNGIDAGKLCLETNGPFIKVNSRLETNLPGVYAIGDLIGGMMLAHKASAEAEAAVDNIMGASKSVDPLLIPRCIWGLLEIGSVGMSEEEAVKAGRKIKTGQFTFMASGAARAMGHEQGFVKIVGDAVTGQILGAHIIGEHATDLIGQVVTVMTMEGAVEDLAEAIVAHPTLGEAILEAALDWNGLAVHIPKKK